MLSAQTIALVKATVPVLQARRSHHPPLLPADVPPVPEVKAFFNEAHQAGGAQPKALAGAVLAYAAHIDRLDEIAGALPRIIHKHVALGVQPEHYPIVGQCLLQAIREVLGAAATDEIIAAWGEAYQALADLLIAAEAQLYDANAQAPGGWRGERALRIARKQAESEVITSFYLEPVDGGALPAFQPGQYLTLVLDIDGQPTRRNYSLSDAPGRPWLRISVKREDGGKVSNWLHDRRRWATRSTPWPLRRLRAGRPGPGRAPAGAGDRRRGHHPGDEHAGGHRRQRPAHPLHPRRARRWLARLRRAGQGAGRAAPERAALLPLRVAPPAGPARRRGPGGRALLAELLPADRDVDLYFLGPKPFMQAVHAAGLAAGVAPERLRWEFFGPLESLQAA
jgi:nitric oxide dioxygenase